jgi:hypothetical protein
MVWLERITPNQLDGKSGAGREDVGGDGVGLLFWELRLGWKAR